MRWFSFFLLVSACTSQASAEDLRNEASGRGKIAARPTEPVYGPVEEMQGIWTSGFEHSGFERCGARSLESCTGTALCWLLPSQAFWERFREVLPPTSTDPGSPSEGSFFYIRFQGRQANNGPFGHMGMYPCQIEGITLISAERRRP